MTEVCMVNHAEGYATLLEKHGERAMRIKPFEFNFRELAGSMGDFGTLIPLWYMASLWGLQFIIW